MVISDLSKLILKNKLSSEDLSLFLKSFINIFLKNGKSIIFPSFINPTLNKGVINLDVLKSDSGILSEIFRKFPGVKRTISPFFSYSIIGKNQNNFIKIFPKYEWSENSHLGWMEENNISCIVLGTFPEKNPLVHRMEFINKEIIKFREIKKFKNKIIYEGKELDHIQYYLNFKKNYEYFDYKNLFLKNSFFGIDTYNLHNLSIYHYKAKLFLELVNKEIMDNPIYSHGKIKNLKA